MDSDLQHWSRGKGGTRVCPWEEHTIKDSGWQIVTAILPLVKSKAMKEETVT